MRTALACLGLLLLWQNQAPQQTGYPVFETDKLPQSEFRARREKIKSEIGSGNIAVIFTSPVRNRNNDVDYLFRGDSNFIYLTGFEEEESALILAPGGFDWKGKQVTEVLFVNVSNAMSETWLGYRMGPTNAMNLLNIEMASPNSDFSDALQAAAASASNKKVSVNFVPLNGGGALGRMAGAYDTWRKASGFADGIDIRRSLTKMREIKSSAEVNMLKKAAEISALAHAEILRSVEPGMREWEIGALANYIFARYGCEYPGYPPIVGSGPNSCILHYMANRRLMQAGDIVCMDTAGEYHGYSADVTRTYPVNGKFSPEQKAIYNIVLEAQSTGISMCRPGSTLGEIGRKISEVMANGLINLGIIQNAGELNRYYMHGFGHGIGLDVHDPCPSTLAPNAVLTVEPGIYIKAGSPCDPKWWNIGVRIEDDILVTQNAPVNLSAGAPRTVEAIEKLMAEKGIGNLPVKEWK